MLEAAGSALGHIFTPLPFLALMIGVLIGMTSGAIPGGGLPGLVVLLGFAYHMDPWVAIPLAIGMMSTVATTDTIPAVLLGVPGSTSGQATILDGYPMAQKGLAGLALSAAYFASLIGGVLGAVFLFVTLPFTRQIVNEFSSAEFFVMSLISVAIVGVLSSGALFKGLAAGAFGLLIAMVGFDPLTATPRLTLGIDYLYDGVPLLPLIVGLFALPELIDLVVSQSAIARQRVDLMIAGGLHDRAAGMREALKNWGLIVRSSIIGLVVGVMPGIGGSLANWLAYAQARQTVKGGTRTFGTGDVRGVIAPEAANNSVDGGDLLPTLGFGIPGSVGMALFLGFLIILGYQPGPVMLQRNMDVLLGIAFSLAIANVAATTIGLFFTPQLARIALIRPYVLVPVVIAILTISAFQATKSMGDLMLMLAATGLGFFMKTYGWPRPPIIIAIVLGETIEKYYFLSMSNYGLALFARPAVLIMIAITVATGIYTIQTRKAARLQPVSDLDD